jgi:hypothetical protein
MGCSSCGSSAPAVPVTSCGSCSPAPSSHADTCRQPPRRQLAPPNTPVTQPWADRMMQALSGKLVVTNGKEFNNLDSAFSGLVFLDTKTGDVWVVNGQVATYIPDCCATKTTGFPVYALDPGCRAVGEHPDRVLEVARPQHNSVGLLYGHQEQCPQSRGLDPEVTPVQIVPEDLPPSDDCPPSGLTLLGYAPFTPDGGCAPESAKWYNIRRIIFNRSDVPVVEEITDEVQSNIKLENYRFAIWERQTCDDGSETDHLKEVTMLEFRRYVAQFTRTVIQEAKKDVFLGTAVLVGSNLANPLGVPDPFSGFHDALTGVAPINGAFDLNSIPGYVKGATRAQIRAITFVDSVGSTSGNATVVVNGITIAQSYLNTGATFGYKNDACAMVQVTNDKFSFDLQANSTDFVSMARLEVLGWGY